jgi:hypothetical protein
MHWKNRLITLVEVIRKKLHHSAKLRWSLWIFVAYTLIGFLILPPILAYLAPKMAAKQLTGSLAVERIAFNPIRLKLDIAGLRIINADGKPDLSIPSLSLNLDLFTSIIHRALVMDQVMIEAPEVDLIQTESGDLRITKTLANPNGDAKEPKTETSIPRFQIDSFLIKNGLVRYDNLKDPAPLAVFQDLNLDLKNISSLTGDEGLLAMDAELPEGGHFHWTGQSTLKPLAAQGVLKLSGLSLESLSGLLKEKLGPFRPRGFVELNLSYLARVEPSGIHLTIDRFEGELRELQAVLNAAEPTEPPLHASLNRILWNLRADLAPGDGPKILLDHIALELSQAKLIQDGEKEPLAEINHMGLTDAALNLDAKSVTIGQINIREGNGQLIKKPLIKKPPSDPVPDIQKTTSPSSPWAFSLGEFKLEQFRLSVSDRSLETPLNYHLSDLSLHAGAINTTTNQAVTFELNSKVDEGGNIKIKGNANPLAKSAQGKILLGQVNLAPIQTLLGPKAPIGLKSGSLSTDLDVRINASSNEPTANISGNSSFDDFHLLLQPEGKRLIDWKSLKLAGLDFSYPTQRLKIRDIQILAPQTSLAIYKDHSTNLGEIAKRFNRPGKPSTPEVTKAKSAPASPDLTITRIQINDAQLDYSDDSLILPFSTHIHHLGGTLSGLSLKKSAKAKLKFQGQIDEYGETRIDGSLAPMDPKSFLDASMIFKNVAMNGLSPYSATFAGRRIESGKLNLDLVYRIENGQLKSTNQIMLERIRLGEHVEGAPDSSLPLDLAIALLEDSEGKISVSIPIEGDVNHPDFHYGPIVWDAFKTLLVNTIKAPFNALSKLFGSSEEAIDTVGFRAGSATLEPPQREKIAQLVSSLSDRPKISLVLHGLIQEEADLRALQLRAVAIKIQESLGNPVQAQEDPDPINTNDGATQRALDGLLKDSGQESMVIKRFEQEVGRQPDRVGLFSGLTGKTSQTPAFYEMALQQLSQAVEVRPEQLESLASTRVEGVNRQLQTETRLPKSRMGIGPSEKRQDDANDSEFPGVRIELKSGP